jgi:hypothetical protein
MQGAGLPRIDQFAGNAMYPQSQQVNTQFATPTQMPTSAEVIRSDYDAVTNPYTGMPVQNFANGGGVKEKDIDLRYSAMPQGSQEYDPRFMPLQVDNRPITGPQAALLRLQIEKQLGKEARLRAAAMGNVMALPGQTGLRGMPGAFEVGYNTPAGIGNLDISAIRAMRGTPDGKVPYGVNARYSIPFAKGGLSGIGFDNGGNVEDPQQLDSAPEVVDYKAQLEKLYQGILGRSTDEGAKGWEDLLSAGYGIDEVARQIGASAEVKNKTIAGLSEESRANDPNDFAGSVTQLYTSALGRTPDAASLEANVNLLNRNPDAFAWLADTVTKSPEAKTYAEKSNVDLQKAFDNNMVNYKHFTPTNEKLTGFHGLLQRAGPYFPYAAAALMTAGATGGLDALAASGAGAGTGTGAAAELMGPTYAELGYTGATQGLGATGAGTAAELMGPTYGELGITGLAEGMAGPTYAEMGYTGLNQAEAIAQADAAAKSGFGLKDAYKTYQRANQVKNLLSGLSGGQQLSGLNSVPNAEGYSAFDPGVRTRGLPSLSAYEKTPWANLMPQISLSRLSDFAPTRNMAAGGMTGLGHLGGYSDGGRLLKGPGDGMSDNIPATISDKQPARLADGEFVVPADVVSHLGNGSTDAGAKQLYLMMDKIRKARTGNERQGKQINPNKFLPKG